jgi:hypothetical protein
MDSTETLKTIGEALCPPSHREGWASSIVGQPMQSGPRRVCVLHSVQARNVFEALYGAERTAPPALSPDDAVRLFLDRVERGTNSDAVREVVKDERAKLDAPIEMGIGAFVGCPPQ